ncbi:hypothetical protein NN3_18260 [Nocardia neocaledoniensis NBRC 108232]|nr:SUKH-4 family immunity protein [Nocardia neocaledoniensis]GEM30819.1 hypothetical protein NN3_18260 [Nocardia neocaledoniensis NBRC 108232]
MSAIDDRLDAIMNAPLARLVVPQRQHRLSSSAFSHWRLPEKQRVSLALWGLPTDFVVRPDYRSTYIEGEPTAPDRSCERRYELGTGIGAADGLRITATACGMVFAIRCGPSRCPAPPIAGIAGTPMMVNSSVFEFVELAWRWRAAAMTLDPLLLLLRPAGTSGTSRCTDRINTLKSRIFEHALRIDPNIIGAHAPGFWHSLILDFDHHSTVPSYITE